MILGTTFSPLQCHYLAINYKNIFTPILLENNYNLVRIGAYWNQIETVRGRYQFEELDWLLQESRKSSILIMLTVGMKAPRWPEYHLPEWAIGLNEQELYNSCLHFIEKVMEHVRGYADVIRYVQVENEPFHKFELNGERSLPYYFVAQEVRLVRSYLNANQKLALTCGLSMTVPLHWQDVYALVCCLRLADLIGFNVYVKMGVEHGKYIYAHRLFFAQLAMYRWVIALLGKEAFIAEMQDEPWEHGSMVHVGKDFYPSWSEDQAKWLRKKLEECGFKMILEWGCEWGYKCSKKE